MCRTPGQAANWERWFLGESGPAEMGTKARPGLKPTIRISNLASGSPGTKTLVEPSGPAALTPTITCNWGPHSRAREPRPEAPADPRYSLPVVRGPGGRGIDAVMALCGEVPTKVWIQGETDARFEILI